MFLEISVVILSIVFLLIAGFSVPLLLQIWRTAKSMAMTIDMLNDSLPGILRNLEEITTNINKATTAVNNHVDNLTPIVRRVQSLVESFLDLEHIVRAGLSIPFFKTLSTVTAVLKGT